MPEIELVKDEKVYRVDVFIGHGTFRTRKQLPYRWLTYRAAKRNWQVFVKINPSAILVVEYSDGTIDELDYDINYYL